MTPTTVNALPLKSIDWPRTAGSAPNRERQRLSERTASRSRDSSSRNTRPRRGAESGGENPRPAAPRDAVQVGGEERDAVEGAAGFLQVAIVGNREVRQREAVGIPVRQGPKQHAADDRKDRGVGADAERERGDGHGQEARAP